MPEELEAESRQHLLIRCHRGYPRNLDSSRASSKIWTSWNSRWRLQNALCVSVPQTGALLQDDGDEGEKNEEGIMRDRRNPVQCTVKEKGSSFRRASADPCVDDHPRLRQKEGETAATGSLSKCNHVIVANSPASSRGHDYPDCKVIARLAAENLLAMRCRRCCKTNVERNLFRGSSLEAWPLRERLYHPYACHHSAYSEPFRLFQPVYSKVKPSRLFQKYERPPQE